MAGQQDDREFVEYLETTLIPDLQEAGSECTAEDFERCVRIIRAQDERTPVVVNLGQLREALRVAGIFDALLAADGGSDSVQVQLFDRDGELAVDLYSNERGQRVAQFTVDLGQAPGETGIAKAVR